MKEEITNAQLFRFCAGETTVKENDRIAAWLDENPEEHQQRLNDVHSMYLVSILCDESEAKLPTRRSAWATSFRRYAAGIAAALLVGFAGSYAFFAFRLNGWAQQQTVIEAPAGQHVRISLNDGSEVDRSVIASAHLEEVAPFVVVVDTGEEACQGVFVLAAAVSALRGRARC